MMYKGRQSRKTEDLAVIYIYFKGKVEEMLRVLDEGWDTGDLVDD